MSLPEFDKLWNYGDPEGTETKFRELLGPARESGDTAYLAELLTQLARTQSLQRKFEEAHRILNEADRLITAGMAAARVRSLLERGRTVNSSGRPLDSVHFFEEALNLAKESDLAFHAVDAAHMLGMVSPGEQSLRWNEEAIRLAESAKESRARGWLGALYNNMGWNYHGLGRHADALRMFEKHLKFRTEKNDPVQIGIARWSIAKTYRFLDRVPEALQIQFELLEQPEGRDKESEGYTREEIGECLMMLGRTEEAKPHFARAWELLHDDPWLKADEAPRLERLKQLGEIGENRGQ